MVRAGVFAGVENLLRELPQASEDFAFITGAMQRRRGIACAMDLLRVSLYHLIHDCSLMDACAALRESKLGDLSAVSLMYRFEKCLPLFEWINAKLMKSNDGMCFDKPAWLGERRVLAVDASDVRITGSKPEIHRLHCVLDIFQMRVLQYKITQKKDESSCASSESKSMTKHGETLCNFHPSSGDLFIGDRVYSTRNSMLHCLTNNADFLLRIRQSHSILYDTDGKRIDLPALLKKLKQGRYLDIQVYSTGANAQRIAHRICAMHQTPKGLRATERRDKQAEHKRNTELRPETKLFHKYIVMATSLDPTISASQILDLYRLRWQIELYFKHLKTQLKFDMLPKRRKAGVIAWLNGKIMIALLLTKIKSRAKLSP